MFRKFLRDVRGDYAIATAVAIVPILGGLGLAIDYSEVSRQRALTLNALDAAGIAAARFFVQGGTKEDTLAYAKEFFTANMNGVDTSGADFRLTLPTEDTGGGLLTVTAEQTYEPYFLGAFAKLLGNAGPNLTFEAEAKIRLKNTLEVALVLDNSGSMDYAGTGAGGKKRIALLKNAAKQLVATLAADAARIKQVDKPVQFSLVPFAASVNVGPHNATENWMDVDGRSPIHHENFDWTTMPTNKKVVLTSGSGTYYKNGTGWGTEEGQKVTRFTLFNELRRVTGTQRVQTGTQETCTGSGRNRSCTTNPVYSDVPVYGAYAGWQGCVEVRPHPYNLDDTAPTQTTPATLYVPMFAPDETDQTSGGKAPNSWWTDGLNDTAAKRQKYMPKYFTPAGQGTAAAAANAGPNDSCTTKPITPLLDVTTDTGKKKLDDAIDAMAPLGATNVPEGIAWGWKTLSHGAPFTDGRAESEKGNDKVLIVLTDGANTYYTPSSLGSNDAAGNKSTYSAYGYAINKQPGQSNPRIFMGTSVNKGDYSNANYTTAMTQHMNAMCEKAKAAGMIVMTVSLDLSTTKADEKGQIEALRSCSSNSRFRKDASGKVEKLFWNTTGGELEKTFREIADELSNLRIVG